MNYSDEAVILEEVEDCSAEEEQDTRTQQSAEPIPVTASEKFNFGGPKYNIILPDDTEIKHFRFISNWERIRIYQVFTYIDRTAFFKNKIIYLFTNLSNSNNKSDQD